MQTGMGNLEPLFMAIVQQITSQNGTNQIGQTTKMWAGCCTETFTDADNFNVSCKC